MEVQQTYQIMLIQNNTLSCPSASHFLMSPPWAPHL